MTKGYAHIADAIKAHAASLPTEAKTTTEITVNGLTLRFTADRPSALAVASKFRKGPGRGHRGGGGGLDPREVCDRAQDYAAYLKRSGATGVTF